MAMPDAPLLLPSLLGRGTMRSMVEGLRRCHLGKSGNAREPSVLAESCPDLSMWV